jgi:hypothetical protein
MYYLVRSRAHVREELIFSLRLMAVEALGTISNVAVPLRVESISIDITVKNVSAFQGYVLKATV